MMFQMFCAGPNLHRVELLLLDLRLGVIAIQDVVSDFFFILFFLVGKSAPPLGGKKRAWEGKPR